MLTGAGRDGLSFGTAYGVEDLTDYEAIETYPVGTFFEFVADVDYAGGNLTRQDWSNEANVDWNGYKVFNYVGLETIQALRFVAGELRNVWFDGQASLGSNRAGLIDIDGGSVAGVRVDGSVSSTAGDASVFDSVKSGVADPIQDVIVSADITASSGSACVIRGSELLDINRVVFTGTLSTTGSATLTFSRSGFVSANLENCFYDSTKNGSISAPNGAFGKTTTQLEDIRTYTDDTFNTDLVAPFFDMVDQGAYVNEKWSINDTLAYPILDFQVEGVTAPSFTFTDQSGNPAVGAVARFFYLDAFTASSPTLANLTWVGSEYTTDANGVATYDDGTDPALDGTKVYGAFAFYAEAGSTEMDTLVGAEIGRQNVDLTNP